MEAAGAAVGAVVGTGFAVAAGVSFDASVAVVPVLPVLVVLAATVVPDPAVVYRINSTTSNLSTMV